METRTYEKDGDKWKRKTIMEKDRKDTDFTIKKETLQELGLAGIMMIKELMESVRDDELRDKLDKLVNELQAEREKELLELIKGEKK